MKVILTGLCSVFFGQEWNAGTNIRHFFGGGFEAAYYDGIRFQFIDNYSVIFWEVTRANGKLEFNLYSQYFRFFYCGNIYCIKKYDDVGLNQECPGIGPAPTITIVPPLVGIVDNELFRKYQLEQQSGSAAYKPNTYVHILLADDSVLNSVNPNNSTIMALHIERESDNPNCNIVETRNVLKMRCYNRLFQIFETIIQGEFIGSLKKTFSP